MGQRILCRWHIPRGVSGIAILFFVATVTPAVCHDMDFGVDVGMGNSFDTALVFLFSRLAEVISSLAEVEAGVDCY